MLGVSLDGKDRQAAQAFIERHDIPYRNLIVSYARGSDWFTQQSGQRWVDTPSFLIYDPSGILRARQVGAVPTDLIEQFIASFEPAG